MSKIGLQFQNGIIGDYDRLLDRHPATLKFLGLALNLDLVRRAHERSPQTLIVLRWTGEGDWALDAEWTRRFSDNAARAFEPFLQAGIPFVAESGNEPIVSNVDEARRLSAAQVQIAETFHARGIGRVAAYEFSVGNPVFGLWPSLLEGLRACEYLALHEYGAPRLDSGAPFYALRHRMVREQLPPDAWRPMLITECGIDGGVLAGRSGGYRAFTNVDDYLAQLSWYDGELQKDSYVVGAHIFLGAHTDPKWQSFDVLDDESDRKKFIAWLGAGTIVPPPPPPPGDPMTRTLQLPPYLTQYRVKADVWQPVIGQPFYGFAGATEPTIDVGIDINFIVKDEQGIPLSGAPIYHRVGSFYECFRSDGLGRVQFLLGAGSRYDFSGGAPPNDQFYVGTEFRDKNAGQPPAAPLGDVLYYGFPDQRHFSNQTTFQRMLVQPPPALPVVNTDDELRALASRLRGVDYLPEAAFTRHARQLKLGVPLTTEGRYLDAAGVRWAWQQFAGGILKCIEGQWDQMVFVAH